MNMIAMYPKQMILMIIVF
nr:unnamed protein product [Callosobruchus analis]